MVTRIAFPAGAFSKAVENVNKAIAREIIGLDALDQVGVDKA